MRREQFCKSWTEYWWITSSLQARKVRFANKQKWLKRAEKYVREYRKKEQDELRLARETKKAGNYYIKPEPRLAFVIRIRGYVFETLGMRIPRNYDTTIWFYVLSINQIPPKVRKVLQLFRLRQINNGIFLKLNKVGSEQFSCE